MYVDYVMIFSKVMTLKALYVEILSNNTSCLKKPLPIKLTIPITIL